MVLRSSFRDAWLGCYSNVGPLEKEVGTRGRWHFLSQAVFYSNAGILLTTQLDEAGLMHKQSPSLIEELCIPAPTDPFSGHPCLMFSPNG